MLCLVMLVDFLPHSLTSNETHPLPWIKLQVSLDLNIVRNIGNNVNTQFNKTYIIDIKYIYYLNNN